MPSTAIEDIHCASEKVRSLVARIPPFTSVPAAIDAEVLGGVLESMALASKRLHELPRDLHDADLEMEIMGYKRNLESLGQVLPRTQGTLLTEKARLEHARVHLEGAAAWVRASKKTL